MVIHMFQNSILTMKITRIRHATSKRIKLKQRITVIVWHYMQCHRVPYGNRTNFENGKEPPRRMVGNERKCTTPETKQTDMTLEKIGKTSKMIQRPKQNILMCRFYNFRMKWSLRRIYAFYSPPLIILFHSSWFSILSHQNTQRGTAR